MNSRVRTRADSDLKEKQNPHSRYDTKYKDVSLELVTKLCEAGYPWSKIAYYLGISEQTISNWRKAHPEFKEAMDEGSFKAVGDVASALKREAVGYFQEWDEQNGKGTWVHKKQWYRGDSGAAMSFLSAHVPEIWRKNQSVDVNHNVEPKNINEIELEGFTRQEKSMLRKALKNSVEGNDKSSG